MSLLDATVILFLILATALYVLAEFAAVSARRSRIHQLAQEGSRLARGLLPIIEDPRRLDRYVGTSQIGITLSSLVLGAYAQASLSHALAPLLGELGGLGPVAAQSAAVTAVLVVLTALSMVLGELMPKSLALQYPAQCALLTYPPMRWSEAVFSWFLDLLHGSGLLILRLLGVPESTRRHIHSPQEIDILLSESAGHGVLPPAEEGRLHRALQLSVRTVSELMVPRPRIVALDADAPLEESLALAAASPYTRMPVYRGTPDTIIGIVHVRDLLVRWVEHDRPAGLEEVMRPVPALPETARAENLLALLRQRHSQMAVVLDEYGGVAGLVTFEDLMAGMLGDTGDEFRPGDPAPERLPDGRVRLPGAMRLHEVEAWIGPVEEGEAETVGGRVIEVLGRFPRQGERVHIAARVEVEVERVGGFVVSSVLALPPRRREGEP
ncbi:MAG: hemolysin family protein [Candidatus Latescibacterota bacterium]